MDEAAFWATIDGARKAKASADPERLGRALSGMPDADVRSFAATFAAQMARLNRWSVWGAGYVIHGGMSDDGFLYFCEWLVGWGRKAVERALHDPDGLEEFVADPGEVDNEGLGAVAYNVLSSRGVEIDPSSYPSEPPTGEPFDEKTVYDAHPRLAAAFG